MSACCALALLGLAVLSSAHAQAFISVRGRHFYLNGEKIFLSGMNIAWYHYGMDFGNGRYDCCTRHTLQKYIDSIADNGGNSIRMWLHCVGATTPEFNRYGYVTSPDEKNTLIDDLSCFLDKARTRNIAVTLVLWNGAVTPTENLKNLILQKRKLQSYINKALVPMVKAFASKQALVAWEIMNEPEGLLRRNQCHPDPCFSTTKLFGSGAGWVGANIPMEYLLRFVNLQAAAIKNTDAKALVTVGSWSEKAQNDAFSGSFNYYKDTCLIKAGGDRNGVIDFYQMHTYTHGGSWNAESPFKKNGTQYQLDKPIVIGEFSENASEWKDIKRQYDHAYCEQYQGAWSWQANGQGHHSDSFQVQAKGTNHLKCKNDQSKGGRVNFVFFRLGHVTCSCM